MVVLCVVVVECPFGEHFVVGEVDFVDQYVGVECDLLVLGEEVVGVAVECYCFYEFGWELFFWLYFCVVEWVEVEVEVFVVVHQLDL